MGRSQVSTTWPLLRQHHVGLDHADVQRLRHVRREAVAVGRQGQRRIQRLVAATASGGCKEPKEGRFGILELGVFGEG